MHKVGRPKGSKDGPRLPGAPLHGRPPKVASSHVGSAGKLLFHLNHYCYLIWFLLGLKKAKDSDNEYPCKDFSHEIILELYQLEVESQRESTLALLFFILNL
jgi:hypothetical protein